MSHRWLITHADDLGLTKSINEGILIAHKNGILTSASLMPSGSAFKQAVELCVATPSLDIGIHLTLVEEAPILENVSILSLIGKNGRFHNSYKVFTKKYLLGQIDLAEVRRELDAQIRKVFDQGISVSHLDSHQHVHMLPKIHGIVIELAKQYNIPAVRLPREKLEMYMLFEKRLIFRIFQLMALNSVCAASRKNEIIFPDYFKGFFYGGRLNKDNLKKMLRNLPHSGTCELMCHPGVNDCDTFSNKKGYYRSKELETLISPDAANFIKEANIKLISYRDLVAFQK